MNIERIRKRLRGGFKPFVILTSDGHEYPVPHPEFIIATPKVLAVADEHGDLATLEPLHIVAIKDLPAKKNGSGKR